jgi:hypothetical protein
MNVRRFPLTLILCAAAFSLATGVRCPGAEDPLRQPVANAIERAKRYLLRQQQPDGSWQTELGTHAVGVQSLALLALLNTGMTLEDREIQKGLAWLRRQDPESTYEISLMIQALAAAKDGKRDVPIVLRLVSRLEDLQITKGGNAGSWSYSSRINMMGDNSNAQFAVLGLREAQEMGVPVSLATWRRAREHWVSCQNGDGGWDYSSSGRGDSSTGSMTVAGIATTVITSAMLKAEANHLSPDGSPLCCEASRPEKVLEDAYRWMGNNFTVRTNPGAGRVGSHGWILYYLYGLERAGRFSGRRFFVNSRGQKHDWYREGAEYLVSQQNPANGTWVGVGQGEQDPLIGTCFSLIFLSKGLAPVLINKLEYGPRDHTGNHIKGSDWNRHQDDVRNLTQHISGLPKWPKLLNWQTVDVTQATVDDLLQAPILFFNGSDAPFFAERDVALLKEYVLQGGVILAVNCCKSAQFDEGFRDLVSQMYPPSEAKLTRLKADHPVFRSEYSLIDPNSGEPAVELWGVDVGCRTSIIYSPHDLSCLWDKWTSFQVPSRPKELVAMITRANQVGVNIVAYVTGRELLTKLDRPALAASGQIEEQIERDLLELRKVRYTGDWDAAPQALRNLLAALRTTVHLPVSAKAADITLLDRNLYKYPILYMHGRHDLQLSKNEQDRLRQFIDNGGFLLADACCGSPQFDQSFRMLVEQAFPGKRLERIPVTHEMFTSRMAFDLKSVKRREADSGGKQPAFDVRVRDVEPFLEGIEVNGRFVVVYSKYDISCALERQASVACTGYVHEDAVRLAVNVVLYALNQ